MKDVTGRNGLSFRVPANKRQSSPPREKEEKKGLRGGGEVRGGVESQRHVGAKRADCDLPFIDL